MSCCQYTQVCENFCTFIGEYVHWIELNWNWHRHYGERSKLWGLSWHMTPMSKCRNVYTGSGVCPSCHMNTLDLLLRAYSPSHVLFNCHHEWQNQLLIGARCPNMCGVRCLIGRGEASNGARFQGEEVSKGARCQLGLDARFPNIGVRFRPKWSRPTAISPRWCPPIVWVISPH